MFIFMYACVSMLNIFVIIFSYKLGQYSLKTFESKEVKLLNTKYAALSEFVRDMHIDIGIMDSKIEDIRVKLQ